MRLLSLRLPLVALVMAFAFGDPPPDDRAAAHAAEPTYTSGRASFAVEFRGDVMPYEVMSIFVMPGAAVELKAILPERRGPVEIDAAQGAVTQTGPKTWRWRVPRESGLVPVTVRDTHSGDAITLNAFVLVPFEHRGEVLNGYRIGRYQDQPLRGDPVYDRPLGFVEVTPETRDVQVSPHFTLGQFACKQESAYPKYLVLRERLVLKLEKILEELNRQGIQARTLHVMSAFRTPFYNQQIGNRTTYSRHLYGGAADIFVDTDGDDLMDDLNGDGAVNEADAEVIARIIHENVDEPWYQPFVGGLGVYDAAPHRGPFVHVDVRGYPARWDG